MARVRSCSMGQTTALWRAWRLVVDYSVLVLNHMYFFPLLLSLSHKQHFEDDDESLVAFSRVVCDSSEFGRYWKQLG